MSKGKRYTEEFKIEVVKQVTDRGYSVNEVAERLGITTKSLYNWRSQLSGKKEVPCELFFSNLQPLRM